jgi:UbiA prenyltransferase family
MDGAKGYGTDIGSIGRAASSLGTALASGINALLSLNRLGRGNAALFLLLSFGAIGTQISVLAHLVLAQTAALWYNGLNDLSDLEIDRAAYAKSAHRKVLLNGAMTPRALWVWLIVLTLASAVLLVVDVRANVWSIALFGAGILCSVVYNVKSKYLARPSVPKCIALDLIVAGPFYFLYASLAVAAAARPDPTVVVGTVGSLVACGLYGNFIFAAKDLSTDAKSTRTLPMMLGSSVGEGGRVRHSPASRSYLWLLSIAMAGLLGYVTWRGYWFGLLLAIRFLVATVQLGSGRVTERGHRRTFVRLSNWEMAFLLSLYLPTLDLATVALLMALGGAIVLANVAYFHDERAGRALMLRFGKAARA